MDHYNTLGVDRSASPEDIKRAYRKLAGQHHPDKGGDTAKFQQIEEAYRTLSDDSKRQQYDNPMPQGFHFNHGGPHGFEDMMAQVFGGGHPFGDIFGQRRQQQQNRTLNIQTNITLEEAFYGKDLIANLQLPSGRNQTIEVKIPEGTFDGVTLRLSGMGDDSFPHLPRGDIHLTVRVEPHERFQRQGDDLVTSINLNCIDAILGKTETITTIDNKQIELKIAPGIQHGQILAAAGYGMPKMNDTRFKGRMLIEVRIVVPKDLNDSQLNKLREVYR
jgi:curved DNA-binding protein